MRILGTAAFVTGAAQGLGKAFAEVLLKHGARVCLSDIQVTKGKQTEAELQREYGRDKVLFLQCDVRSPASFSNAFQEAVSTFGAINLLVNNAGIGKESKPVDMIGINLTGVVIGTNLGIKHMRQDMGGKGGTIINVASTAGLAPIYCTPVYAATKFGVVGFTRSWASNPHVEELGVQFGCLCPAFTKTAIMEFEEGATLYPEEASQLIQLVGINEVDDVAKGFLELVEKDDCNGDVMTVTSQQGIQYSRRSGNRSGSRRSKL